MKALPLIHLLRKSLKYKLCALTLVLINLIMLLVGITVTTQERKALLRQMQTRGISITRNLAENTSTFLLNDDDLSLNNLVSYLRNDPVIEYALVVDTRQIIRAHTDINQLKRVYQLPEGLSLEEGEVLRFKLYESSDGRRHYHVMSPILFSNQRLGTVHVGFSQDYITAVVNEARNQILKVTLIMLALGTVGAYGLALLIVKPINQLAADAEILGKGDLDKKIVPITQDEIGRLAETLDITRTKLKAAQETLVIKERLDRELQIAQQIQQALFPKTIPSLPNLEIATLYRAAAEVGGDFYDFFWVNSKELGMVIADVAGKGIPGSLVMTMVKSILRTSATQVSGGELEGVTGPANHPVTIMVKTNRIIYPDMKKGMFITANYGILNTETLTFTFVSAGHNDTLVYNSKTGKLKRYNPKGMALGVDPGPIFEKLIKSFQIQLTPGDLLLQYTDGVNEAMDTQRVLFGNERLYRTLQKYGGKSAAEFLNSLDREIKVFTRGHVQSDDITAIVLKVL